MSSKKMSRTNPTSRTPSAQSASAPSAGEPTLYRQPGLPPQPPKSLTPLLDAVQSPDDLKRLTIHQLPQLSAELRGEIVRVCSVGGLHLASSLGATDLIVALHYVLNSPRDKHSL